MSPNEVVRLRDHLNGVVEDLKQRLEKGESDLREKWRREGERLRERQEEEKKGIYARQERDMAELRYSAINISHFPAYVTDCLIGTLFSTITTCKTVHSKTRSKVKRPPASSGFFICIEKF